MKLKPFTLFLFSVSILLILFFPIFLHSITTVNPDEIPYKGILSLWNITDWRTGGSSCLSFLKKRAQEFESKNGYSFIEINDMTVSDAKEALKSGKVPDIISFPYGFEPELKLSPLQSINTIFQLSSTGAYPYMCGGYGIIINTDMLDRDGLLTPEGWGVSPAEFNAIAKLGVAFDSEEGYSSLPAAIFYKFPKEQGPDFTINKKSESDGSSLNLTVNEYSGGLDPFCNGKSCVLIASQRQLYEAKLLYEDNKAPSYKCFALSGYTDMAQLIGVVSCDDRKKLKVCSDFAQYLLSDSVQKKLEALGVFPVIKGLDIYQTDESFRSIYDLLCTDGYFPLYEDRTNVYELARKALSEDSNALLKLRNIAGYKN